MLVAERLEIVEKERIPHDNLSHSTPAHQKKPKTRHFLVVLFRVSFNFLMFLYLNILNLQRDIEVQ